MFIIQEKSISFLVCISASENSVMCRHICSKKHNLLRVLNQIILSQTLNQHQNLAYRNNVLWIFANICADQDSSLRIEVIKRTNLVDMFDSLISNEAEDFDDLLPWLICQIFTGGMTHHLDNIFETCALLMGSVICRILNSEKY